MRKPRMSTARNFLRSDPQPSQLRLCSLSNRNTRRDLVHRPSQEVFATLYRVLECTRGSNLTYTRASAFIAVVLPLSNRADDGCVERWDGSVPVTVPEIDFLPDD